MGRRIIFKRTVSVVILVAVSLFMSGCGTKREAPEGAAELDSGRGRIEDWYALIKKQSDSPEMEKLQSVNNFFNRMEFVDDAIHWGKEDYWSTPQEMLISNGGDCEDFATAKYFTLRHLNVPDEKMRLTYVKSLKLNQSHMVLSYYPEPTAEPLVLDNLVAAILVASQRMDLIPVYSFNARGVWLTRKQSSSRLGGTERMSLWQELQSRFSREILAAPLP